MERGGRAQTRELDEFISGCLNESGTHLSQMQRRPGFLLVISHTVAQGEGLTAEVVTPGNAIAPCRRPVFLSRYPDERIRR